MPIDASIPNLSSKLWGQYTDPSAAVPDFEQDVLEKARDDYGTGAPQALVSKQVRDQLKQRSQVEDQAFKQNLSTANPSYGSALTSLGMGAGAGLLLDHAMRLGNLVGFKHKAQPLTTHLKNMVNPFSVGSKGMGMLRYLPLAFTAQHYLGQALSNPKYQRGEQGYLSSLGTTLENTGQSTRESMDEANQRYGTLGALPLHALNIAMDPVGGALAGVSKGKEMLFGKSSEYLLMRALTGAN